MPWTFDPVPDRHSMSTNSQQQQGTSLHSQTHQPSPARVGFFDEQLKPRIPSYNSSSDSIFAPSAPRLESRGFRPLNSHHSAHRSAASPKMGRFDELMNVPVFPSPVISFKAPAMASVLPNRTSIESTVDHEAYTLEAGNEDGRSAAGI